MDSEKNFSLDELIEKGKHDGSISNEDLLDAIGGYQDFDMDQIDKIYETLVSDNFEAFKAMELNTLKDGIEIIKHVSNYKK